MAALDGTLKGTKLGLALGFGGVTLLCGAAFAWSWKAVVSAAEGMKQAYHFVPMASLLHRVVSAGLNRKCTTRA